MKNDFLAMKKFFPWPKTHFPSISQANMYFFSSGKKFLSGQKIFVQADGQGIRLIYKNLCSSSPLLLYGEWQPIQAQNERDKCMKKVPLGKIHLEGFIEQRSLVEIVAGEAGFSKRAS